MKNPQTAKRRLEWKENCSIRIALRAGTEHIIRQRSSSRVSGRRATNEEVTRRDEQATVRILHLFIVRSSVQS